MKRVALHLAACVLCLLLLPTAALAQERTFLLEGRYGGHETGDLSYLILNTREKDYYMACDAMILQALDALQISLPIVVEFSHTRQFMEGAGEEVDFQVVESVFIPDEYAPDFGIRISRSARP